MIRSLETSECFTFFRMIQTLSTIKEAQVTIQQEPEDQPLSLQEVREGGQTMKEETPTPVLLQLTRIQATECCQETGG